MFCKKKEKKIYDFNYSEFDLKLSLNETKYSKFLIIENSNSYKAYSFQDFFSKNSSITHLEILLPISTFISIHPVYQWSIDYAFVEKSTDLEKNSNTGCDVISQSLEFISGHFVQKDPNIMSKTIFKLIQPLAPLVIKRSDARNKLLLFQYRYYNQKNITSSQIKLELDCYFIGRFKNENKNTFEGITLHNKIGTIQALTKIQIDAQKTMTSQLPEIDKKVFLQEMAWKDEIKLIREEIINQGKIVREQSESIAKLSKMLLEKEQKIIELELKQIDQDNKTDIIQNKMKELLELVVPNSHDTKPEFSDDSRNHKDRSINSIEQINNLNQSHENIGYSKLSKSCTFEAEDDDDRSTMSRITDLTVKTINVNLVSENSFNESESFIGSKESKENEKELIQRNNRLLARNKELVKKTINQGKYITIQPESNKKSEESSWNNSKNSKRTSPSNKRNMTFASLKDTKQAPLSSDLPK